MKLVTFLNADGKKVVGLSAISAETKDRVILNLQESFEWLKAEGKAPSHISPRSTTDMVTFIKDQEQTLPSARSVLAAWQEGRLPKECFTDEDKTKLLAPVTLPNSIRDGYAFRQHVETARRNRGVPMIPEFDEFPVFYFTNRNAVTGPGDVTVMPKALERLDFELEVAVVVGKAGKNIPANKVDEHIFGYMIFNDWSARALQMQEMKLNLGPAKGKDFANSFGPYLVTRSALEKHRITGKSGERYDLKMKAYLNGKQLSEGNLKDMNWTFGQILERASYGVELQPGDVIGSGTVGTGCLLELNGSKITDNLWIKAGDSVVLEVDELGRLENKIVAGHE